MFTRAIRKIGDVRMKKSLENIDCPFPLKKKPTIVGFTQQQSPQGEEKKAEGSQAPESETSISLEEDSNQMFKGDDIDA